jgi:hypothetical protein
MLHTSETDARIARPLRAVLFAAALIVTGFILVVFALAVPVRFNQLAVEVSSQDLVLVPGLTPELEAGPTSRLGPAEAAALHALGISNRFYAAYILFFDVGLVLLGAVIAAVIFLRKADNWLAVLTAYIVVLLGTNSVSMVVPSLSFNNPGWYIGSLLFGVTGMVSHVHLFFLSPDGSFVPAWTRRLAAAFSGAALGYAAYSITALPNVLLALAGLLTLFPIWIVFLGLGILAQVYRYRRISNPVQRQQTKWIAAGLTMTLIGIVINIVFLNASYQFSGAPRLLLYLVRAPLVNGFLMFFALSLAFSIFRYRLWDIDFLIRRTTTYAALTAFLAVIYLASVVTLHTLFSAFSAQRSPFSIVISTLVIAALARPLQGRVQHFIDSRFYRVKYDAERTLARFAHTAQAEVDLDRLGVSLLEVVEKAMRPQHSSLWIREEAYLLSRRLPKFLSTPAVGAQAADQPTP